MADYSIKRNPNVATSLTASDKLELYDASTGLQLSALVGAVVAAPATTKAWSTAGPTDNVDVTGVGVLLVDTSAATVTIGGLAGGVAGQRLDIIKTSASNNLVLENAEGGGSQDMVFAAGADQTLAAVYGGYHLVCDGTRWICSGIPLDTTI